MNDIPREWAGESDELKPNIVNIFPTDAQAKDLYQMREGEALSCEFNTGSGEPKGKKEWLEDVGKTKLWELTISGKDFRITQARDPQTKAIIPGRVVVITRS